MCGIWCALWLVASPFHASHASAADPLSELWPKGHYIAEGDDPRWADADYDHSNWRYQRHRRIDVPPAIRWVRVPIDVPDPYLKGDQPFSLIVAGQMASDVYWNGVLIGNNGSPGTSEATEIPGTINERYYIPPHIMQRGENIIAIRMSSQQLASVRNDIDLEILVAPHRDINHTRLVRHLPAVILFGAIGAGVVMFGAMFFMHRRDTGALWLALTFLMLAGQFGAEVYKSLVNYIYYMQYYRYLALVFFAYGSVLFLLFFTLWRIGADKRIVAGSLVIAHVATGLLAATSNLLEPKIFYMILSFVGVSFALAVYGFSQKKEACLPLSIGLAIVCFAGLEGPMLFLDRAYFYSMALLAGVLFFMQAQDFRRSEHTASQAAAQSARMELELLKKHIQPHFMMNTLGALTEWIMESPEASVDMIHVLADEFRLLHDVSSKKKVPLKQEVALCEAHLKIMSYRQDQTLLLVTELEEDTHEIPPAIFHTLLENALTHNRYKAGKVEFRLEQALGANEHVTYTLVVPPGQTSAPARSESAGGGLGLTYIEARLKEVWPGAYKLTSGQTADGGWKTTIAVNRQRVTV